MLKTVKLTGRCAGNKMCVPLVSTIFVRNIFHTSQYLASYIFVGDAGHLLWRTGAKYEALSVAFSPALLYLPVNI
jgi:hypothetical protein